MIKKSNIEKEVFRAKEIVREKPDGATHYCVLQYDCTEVYIRIDKCKVYTLNVGGKDWGYKENFDLNGFHSITDIEDLERIVKIQDEIDKLKIIRLFCLLIIGGVIFL